jgi:uncharacterized protein (DUF305 family)
MHSNASYRLAGMTALSFVSMYVLMYAMVNRSDNVFNGINQIYMAGLMTAPMVVIELVLMGSMYPYSNFNRLIIATAALVGCVLFLMIRQQTLIGDRQFLRSMIPHHAGAVLMCEKANLQSTDIKTLCASIISGQNAELDRMKEMLKR